MANKITYNSVTQSVANMSLEPLNNSAFFHEPHCSLELLELFQDRFMLQI